MVEAAFCQQCAPFRVTHGAPIRGSGMTSPDCRAEAREMRMAGSDEGVTKFERKQVARSPVRRPTPIPISRTVRKLMVVAIGAGLAPIVWAVPAVLVILLGGLWFAFE